MSDLLLERPIAGPPERRLLEGPTLRDIVAQLWRHRFFLATAALLFAVGGVLTGLLASPRYIAEGMLVTEAPQFNIPDLQALAPRDRENPWAGRSEAKVLQSPEIIEQVVDRLHLTKDPAFNPFIRRSPLDVLIAHVPELRLLVRPWGEEAYAIPPSEREARAATVAAIRQDLTVFSEERSLAITVSYSGREAESTAAVVNEIMAAYIDQDLRQMEEATRQARSEVKARMDALKAELEAAQLEIRQIEARSDLVETAAGSIDSQRAAQLSEERQRVRNERAAVEVEIVQLDRSLASDALSVLSEHLVTPRLKALSETEAALQRQIAENTAELGSEHPRMRALANEIDRVRAEMRREVLAIRDGLVDRASELARLQDDLNEEFHANRDTAAATAESRLRMRQLQERADATLALFAHYRMLFEQTSTNQAVLLPSARIVARAISPERPSGPSAKLRAAIGMAIGLLLSAAAVLASHWMADRVSSLDEAVDLTGGRPLGTLPWVRRRLLDLLPWSRRRPGNLADDRRQGSVVETIRGIIYRLGVGDGRGCRVIMVTSPFPGDGKSTLAAAMARIGSRDGLRCLVLDCDFHRSSMARIVPYPPLFYLDQYRGWGTPVEHLLVEDPSGADFILARPMEDWSRADFERLRLDELLRSVRTRYDLVVIDTPPLLAVVDPLFVSRMADGVLLVIAWRRLSRRLAREAVERLRALSCPLAGVVLSQVRGETDLQYAYQGYPAS